MIQDGSSGLTITRIEHKKGWRNKFPILSYFSTENLAFQQVRHQDYSDIGMSFKRVAQPRGTSIVQEPFPPMRRNEFG